MQSNSELKLYIDNGDLWNKEVENDLFQNELDKICIDEIKVGHCYYLFNLLDGDGILNDEINKINKDKNKDTFSQRENKNRINIDNQNGENNQNEKDENKGKEENDGETYNIEEEQNDKEEEEDEERDEDI